MNEWMCMDSHWYVLSYQWTNNVIGYKQSINHIKRHKSVRDGQTMPKIEDTVFLFDVDGTLTPSRQKASADILEHLRWLRQYVKIAFVGGSDLCKQQEQLSSDILSLFDYSFPENGVSYYRHDQLISKKRLVDHVGEERLQRLINFVLHYLSTITLPRKRGTFIEMRDSMINISPIGRQCTQEERKEFLAYDKQNQIRENMVAVLKKEFGQDNIHFSVGGEISIDVFPHGWDKRYCVKHLIDDSVKNIYFFGDMVHPGGNDYEIFNDERVYGVQVASPADTMEKSRDLLGKIREERDMSDIKILRMRDSD